MRANRCATYQVLHRAVRALHIAHTNNEQTAWVPGGGVKIGVRLFGLFDVDVARLSSVLEPLAAMLRDGTADFESLMKIRKVNFDQRNVIGGNMRMTNSTVRARGPAARLW